MHQQAVAHLQSFGLHAPPISEFVNDVHQMIAAHLARVSPRDG
jgi:hypothetical protein